MVCTSCATLCLLSPHLRCSCIHLQQLPCITRVLSCRTIFITSFGLLWSHSSYPAEFNCKWKYRANIFHEVDIEHTCNLPFQEYIVCNKVSKQTMPSTAKHEEGFREAGLCPFHLRLADGKVSFVLTTVHLNLVNAFKHHNNSALKM